MISLIKTKKNGSIKNQDCLLKDTDSTSLFNIGSSVWSVFENSSHGVMLTCPDGRIFASNKRASGILGWTEHEFRSLGRPGIVDSTDRKWIQALKTRKRTGIFEGELKFRHRDGSLIPVNVSSRVFQTDRGLDIAIVIFKDARSSLVPKTKIVDPLRLSNNIKGAVIPGVALLSFDGKIKPLNETFMSMLGYDGAGQQSLDAKTLFGAGDNHLRLMNFMESSCLSKDVLETEMMVQHRNGEELFMTLTICPVDSSSSKCSCVLVMHDISFTDQSRLNPLHDQGLLETLLEKSPSSVGIRDNRGRFVFLNGNAISSFGLKDNNWRGLKIEEVFSADVAYLVRQTDKICLEEGTTLQYNMSVRDCKGALNTWRITKFPHRGLNGMTYVLSMATNINDCVNAERSYEDMKQRYIDLLNGLKKAHQRMKPLLRLTA